MNLWLRNLLLRCLVGFGWMDVWLKCGNGMLSLMWWFGFGFLGNWVWFNCWFVIWILIMIRLFWLMLLKWMVMVVFCCLGWFVCGLMIVLSRFRCFCGCWIWVCVMWWKSCICSGVVWFCGFRISWFLIIELVGSVLLKKGYWVCFFFVGLVFYFFWWVCCCGGKVCFFWCFGFLVWLFLVVVLLLYFSRDFG